MILMMSDLNFSKHVGCIGPWKCTIQYYNAGSLDVNHVETLHLLCDIQLMSEIFALLVALDFKLSKVKQKLFCYQNQSDVYKKQNQGRTFFLYIYIYIYTVYIFLGHGF